MGKTVKQNIQFKIKKVIPTSKKEEATLRRKCYTGVSISNPFFNSEITIPFFKWILRNFEYCCVFIDDYFHKYNEMSFSGKSEKECLQIAKERGSEVETYISNIIDHTFDEAYRFRIIKSSQLAENSLFKKNKEIFSDLFLNNILFKKSIEVSAFDYTNRQLKRGNTFAISKTEVVNNCCNYLIDEIAVFTTICELGYTVEVYPGPELPVLIDIANGIYEGIPASLLNRINIELKLKK